jgi:hypothetical protein
LKSSSSSAGIARSACALGAPSGAPHPDAGRPVAVMAVIVAIARMAALTASAVTRSSRLP